MAAAVMPPTAITNPSATIIGPASFMLYCACPSAVIKLCIFLLYGYWTSGEYAGLVLFVKHFFLNLLATRQYFRQDMWMEKTFRSEQTELATLNAIEFSDEMAPDLHGQVITYERRQEILYKRKILEASEEVILAKEIEAGLVASHVLDHLDRKRTPQGCAPEKARTCGIFALGKTVERQELAALEQAGKEAKDLFVVANIGIAHQIARRRTKDETSMEDNFQNGILGLFTAVTAFDYKKGWTFINLGKRTISQSISNRAFRETRLIRLPVPVEERIVAMRRGTRDFIERHNRQPTSEELATLLDQQPEAIARLKDLTRSPFSIHHKYPYNEKHDYELQDVLVDSEQGEVFDEIRQRLIIEQLHELIDSVQDLRDKDILRSSYGFRGEIETLEKMGKRHNVSHERIRQLRKAALGKLSNRILEDDKYSELRGFVLGAKSREMTE